jgi:hypothetical protein
MDKTSRRQAIRDFKEKKVQPGVFAIRCTPSGETWVGAAQNLESQQTRYWFGLRNGGHINRAMQAAWTAHGETAFDFEVLEEIDDEGLTPLGRADLIKAREAHWREALGAKKAAG